MYKHLHREVKELRSFSRTNFDLAIRLVKHYRKTVGRSSRVAGAMWRYVSEPSVSNCLLIGGIDRKKR